MSNPKRYVNVKVPEELADEIDKIISEREMGYRSRAEFMVEAARQRLMDIKKSRIQSDAHR